jgi:hypothetical protein
MINIIMIKNVHSCRNWKSKIKVLADTLLGERPPSGCLSSCYSFTGQKQNSLMSLSSGTQIPSHGLHLNDLNYTYIPSKDPSS